MKSTTFFKRGSGLGALVVLALGVFSGFGHGKANEETASFSIPPGRVADAEQIWAQELKIFEQRAGGDMGYYLSLANPGYMAWPAPAETPLSYQTLSKQIGDGRLFAPGEQISVSKKGMSFDGDTALAFFETHRTRRAGGEQVDERFENIHVWVRRDTGWRLIANMSRPVLENRAQLGNPTLRGRND